MTGGRLYAHSIESNVPGIHQRRPHRTRRFTREKSPLTESAVRVFTAPLLHFLTSYTVLRNKLDPWLMAQAEQAGAQFIGCTGRRSGT